MRGVHGHQLSGGDDARSRKSGMKTVWRVFAYLKRYPLLATGMLACAIVGTLMVPVFPLVTKQVLDVVIRQHHPEKLLPLVLLAVLAALLQNGLSSLRLVLNNTFEQRVIFDLRSDLYTHIQLLPLRWFGNRATGDLMTRLLEDVTFVHAYRRIDFFSGSLGLPKESYAEQVEAASEMLAKHPYAPLIKCAVLNSRSNLAEIQKNCRSLRFADASGQPVTDAGYNRS